MFSNVLVYVWYLNCVKQKNNNSIGVFLSPALLLSLPPEMLIVTVMLNIATGTVAGSDPYHFSVIMQHHCNLELNFYFTYVFYLLLCRYFYWGVD
jgi:hypothetical protein